MIVEFSVKNFRSIHRLQTISFVATNLVSSKENSHVDENNIFEDGDQRLLKTVGIYGANASGKSNMIKALEYFAQAVEDLPSPKSRLSDVASPFLYQDAAENTESFFQILLIVEGKKYRYGFTVKKNQAALKERGASREIITSEWLFGPKTKNQTKYFTRKNLDIDKSNLPEGGDIAPLKHEHILFLTHAASYNQETCRNLQSAIGGRVTHQFRHKKDFFRYHAVNILETQDQKSQLINFFQSFGLPYKDIHFKKDDELERLDEYPLEKLFLVKDGMQASSNDVVLNMQKHESDGTQKLFDLAGLLLLAFSFPVGGLIILDEIDSNFHPALLVKLIEVFNNPEINKANVQLLFTSHDTILMNPSLMRRDQFYFTEKQADESTKLYSLAELKGIRNDADFAKHYLAGFYGALPMLSEYVNQNTTQDAGTLGY